MSDSDEFGDLDDTAFLDAATQFEQTETNNSPFLESGRPLKRRKIVQPNERTRPIPDKTARRPGPFDDSSGDESEDEYQPTSRRKRKPVSPVDDDSETLSTAAISVSSTTRKRTSRARGSQSGENSEKEASPRRKSLGNNKANRIHIPTVNVELGDVFFTQPPREHSPPWKPRGAIWQKSAVSIGVHRPSGDAGSSKWTGLDAMKTMALPGRQSISSRPISRATMTPEVLDSDDEDEAPPKPLVANEPVEEYDPAQDLADLPSDAFASSSSSPQKQDEVTITSERRTRVVAPQTGLRQTTLFGREGVSGDVPPSQVNKRYNFVATQKPEPPTHHKLDVEAMKTWVYPTNLGTTRDYQFNIVARGLFHNLLVALPTGLGKTFIAATIMLNWFRWTVDAQIVFVAPTKPLVTQQVEACFTIVGIPRSETTLLTGNVAPGIRAEEWAKKRVFFMTPQTLINDLKTGIADPKKIVLLVVDEAHRATGGYAYVEVVSFLKRFNQSFRVLALTATPGADVEAVQKVIDGLKISRIEIRTENSLDIRNYVHSRKVEKHVFDNSDEMEMCMELYKQALQKTVNKVASLNAFWSKDPLDLTAYGCVQASRSWQGGAGQGAPPWQKFMVMNIFQILGSLAFAMDLLKYHGIGPFYMKLKEFRDNGEKSKSTNKKEICEHESFQKLMIRLQTWVHNDDFIGHPKLEYLQEVILEHFVNAGEGRNSDAAPPSQTRIMVFAHFRDSAEDIVRVLKRHQPMIRPRVFVGQSQAKNSEGMGQKEQQTVIDDFKMGKYNTLVATSIGEEGLDIGEVDLIICYDSKASPIRMLQRMGRTGRKRQGKIVLLQMKGKEEKDAEKAKDSYERMQELIADGSKFAFHDEESHRIVPKEIQPVVDKRVVEIPIENSQADFLPEPTKKGRRAPKRPPKKFYMPDGVITGFVTAGRMDEEVQPKRRGKKKEEPTYPSDEPIIFPPLESVLLNGAETKDLEQRYQTVYDEDDALLIAPPELDRNPACQRVFSRTHLVRGHGRITKAVVNLCQRMHGIDNARVDEIMNNVYYGDYEPEKGKTALVCNDYDDEQSVTLDADFWEDDDPAPPKVPTRAKPGPKPKAKPPPKAAATPDPDPWEEDDDDDDDDNTAPQPAPTKPKPGPKPKAKATKEPTAPKAKTTPKAAAPRTRPKNDAPPTTPAPRPKPKVPTKLKKSSFRASALAEEGEESSPPPTDPRMHIASQADSLGSDDTERDPETQDKHAYLLDSDLMSFIVEDDEDVNMPESSLPSLNLDLAGLGKGTQAVVKAAMPKKGGKRDKIFTSDTSDDDKVVSSDSDEDVPVRKTGGKKGRGKEVLPPVAESATEDDEPVIQPRQRARRAVVEDSEDEE
ncbi:P-loop containing nucleoside triphosphate hydrolase protein [Amniculicola lignicola CBS 123094]|uniref:ATP-dependent DNA helicase n=1 Tax=Amniculicola lignicola CBS 123094 TaxID=1392246 RepID=A0A6A5WJT0_9PLEO|nr:P-loop containing nucleoside triphosphate hydrolase protein [Amniculicola lignicola CBS 123094]